MFVFASNLVGSLKQPKDDAMRNYFLAKEGDKATVGLQDMMGNASSTNTIAESFVSFLDSSNTVMPTFSISLMENSPNIPSQPTLDEIIAFGGIPKASNRVRSNARLENRPDVDIPQMEKAMRNAQMRDTSCSSGISLVPEFSIVNIPDDEICHRADRLGVSLCVSEEDVAKSIKGIKLLEEGRILTIL
jgi:hypothetical protein